MTVADAEAIALDGIQKGNNATNLDARRMRKAVFRRTIDYNASVIRYLNERLWQRNSRDKLRLQPDYLYNPLLCPPHDYLDCPSNCVMSKPVRTSTNKNKCPIYCVCWTPEGRRLITGAYSGEFTLWNGLTFNFETILQAHESQIRCMNWSHNEEWLLTADHSGFIKYWQANMNNVEMYQAHKEPIRGVSFCPFDNKFVTCSDDSTVRIWDFNRCAEERVLRGHGSDVRSVAWHPYMSLIISGSKDAQQPIKLWEPKTGESITTLYVHKNTCTDVAWHQNGNWFLTASRDHLIKLFDLRNLKTELQIFRGHMRDVMRVSWHPFLEGVFASGSADGAIFYWLVGTETELGAVDNAHESMIWSLAWHPLGHILVSGANDFATKFWTRNRPGDILKETVGSAGADGLIQLIGSANATSNAELGAADILSSSAHDLRSISDSAFKPLDTGADELAFQTNPDDVSHIEVPGINEGIVSDLNVSEGDEYDDRERSKIRNTRTIPKEFVANWASTRITAMPSIMMPTAAPPTSAMAAAAAVAAISGFAAAAASQYAQTTSSSGSSSHPSNRVAPSHSNQTEEKNIHEQSYSRSRHGPTDRRSPAREEAVLAGGPTEHQGGRRIRPSSPPAPSSYESERREHHQPTESWREGSRGYYPGGLEKRPSEFPSDMYHRDDYAPDSRDRHRRTQGPPDFHDPRTVEDHDFRAQQSVEPPYRNFPPEPPVHGHAGDFLEPQEPRFSGPPRGPPKAFHNDYDERHQPPNHEAQEPWNCSWSEYDGYDHTQPRHPPPARRQPPQRNGADWNPPPPQGVNPYPPDMRFPPHSSYPGPHKRPGPPPPPPEHPRKFLRGEGGPHWNDR